MENKIVLELTPVERDKIVYALEALHDEYKYVSEQVASRYLAAGFLRDGNEIGYLRDKIVRAVTILNKEELDKQALQLMDRGSKIDAIKLVRTHRLLGLQDAKNYVEKIQAAL